MTQRSVKSSNVMREFLTLPLVLGSLLIATGGIGLYVVRHSTTSLNKLESAGIKPTVALAEFSTAIHEFLEDLMRINQKGVSPQTQAALLERSRTKIQAIGAATREQIELSRGQPYETYLKKWSAEWSTFQTQTEPLLVSVDRLEPEIPKIDETVTDMLDKMSNMNDFIQYSVKKVGADQASFSGRSTVALSITLLLGIIIGTFSSFFVIRGISRLFKIIADGKKNIETLLNNLDQGFFVFDRSNRVLDGVSRAAVDFLGADPSGQPFHTVLPVETKARENAKGWQELVFEGQLPFVDFKPLAPRSFERAGRYVELDFRPIYGEDGQKLDKVICIASDKTEERRLREQAENESAFVKIVMAALSDRPNFVGFVLESRALFSDLKAELASPKPESKSLIRGVHTLKGAFATFNLVKLGRQAHRLENTLVDMRIADPASTPHFLPQLVQELAEMSANFEAFLKENEQIFGKIGNEDDRVRVVPVTTINDLCQMIFKQIGKESPVFSSFVDKFVLEDFSTAFRRYETVVQNIAEREFKKAVLTIDSGTARVFLDPYQPLISAYVHVFRNAVDHGIEDESTRVELGKPAEGKIQVRFERLPSATGPDRLQILVEDDGQGIDVDVVKQKALEKGLIDAERSAGLKDQEVFQLLFLSGFSTRGEATDISGRGVGLDALKFEVEKLGGKVSVESAKGSGTKLYVQVPYYDSPILSLQGFLTTRDGELPSYPVKSAA